MPPYMAVEKLQMENEKPSKIQTFDSYDKLQNNQTMWNLMSS
jgi:hypothetical protein